MIFVTLSLILKNFSLGAGWNAKIQCISLTHVIANRLNLKYRRRDVMAEWLTHLAKDVVFESLRIRPVINFPPLDVNVCLGVFLACYSQRFEDKRTTRNSQLYCFIKLTTK